MIIFLTESNKTEYAKV